MRRQLRYSVALLVPKTSAWIAPARHFQTLDADRTAGSRYLAAVPHNDRQSRSSEQLATRTPKIETGSPCSESRPHGTIRAAVGLYPVGISSRHTADSPRGASPRGTPGLPPRHTAVLPLGQPPNSPPRRIFARRGPSHPGGLITRNDLRYILVLQILTRRQNGI